MPKIIFLFIASIGLIAFLLISSIGPFKGKFNNYYPKPASIAATSQIFGINDNPTRYDDTRGLRQMDWTKQGKLQMMRIDVNWVSLEPNTKGQYDNSYLSRLDQIMGELEGRGLRPMVVFLTAPNWSHSNSTSVVTPPDNPADLGDIMGFLANRYKSYGNVVYEVWNEPNCPPYFWVPSPGKPDWDPAGYTSLLKAAYPKIKAADPTSTVLGGVLCYSDANFLQQMYNAGAKGYMDGLSFHPYSHNNPPDFPADPNNINMSDWNSAAMNFSAGIDLIQKTMTQNGDNKPMWLTEWGWQVGTCAECLTEQTRVQYITKAVQIIQSKPNVQGAAYFTLKSDDFPTMNLFDQNNNPTSSWIAYTSAAQSQPTPVPTPTPIHPSGNQIQNSTFDSATSNGTIGAPWALELKGIAQASMWKDTTNIINGPSGRVDITQIDPAAIWYLQLWQPGLVLSTGKVATISFWAKAASNRTANLNIQQGQDPWTVYFNQDFALTTNWQKYSFSYTPGISDYNARFIFNLGQQTGQIWFDDVYYCDLNCVVPIQGDLDGNGKVDIFDYNTLVGNFGKSGVGPSGGDINGNGTVDIFDYNLVVGNFGKLAAG
jgi:hypothetical protein